MNPATPVSSASDSPSAPRPEKRAANAERQRDAVLRAGRALTAEHGPAGVRLADLIAVAGVSRNTFYRHFSNVEHCVESAATESAELLHARVRAAAADGAAGRLDRAVRGLVDLATDDSTAFQTWTLARMHRGHGDALADPARTGLDLLARHELSRTGPSMPPEIAYTLVGGLLTKLYLETRGERAGDPRGLAPELLGWLLAYPPPPAPLPRLATPDPPCPPATAREKGARARILAATAGLLAERQAPRTTISDVAQRAGVSFSTFYAHFDGLDTVALALAERRERDVEQAVAAATRGKGGWQLTVHSAIHAALTTLARDPGGSLAASGALSDGATALDRHARTFAPIESLLVDGHALYPATRRVAAAAVAATLAGVLNDHALTRRVHELPALAPALTFVALSPFLPHGEALRLATLRASGP